MYDITWCANSEKCKRKDCERRLSKRPKRGVAYIFATPDEVENLNCTVKYPYEVI